MTSRCLQHRVISALLTCLAAAAAGAACTVPNPAYTQDGFAAASDGEGSGDLATQKGDPPAGPHDGGTSGLEAAVPKEASVTQPDKGVTQPAQGQICTTAQGCPTGSLCVYAEAGATKGICLKTCTNLDKPCPVSDPKLLSGCASYWNPDLGKVQLCVIFCKTPTGSYPCPNTTSYKCKVYSSGLGMCVPR